MVGGMPAAIAICGETLESACGTGGDGAVYVNNPYDCKGCDTVTIYDGFPFSRSLATERPACQGVFNFPEDYGDVYYSDSRLYDAFGKCTTAPSSSLVGSLSYPASGNQIGDVSCEGPVTWG